MVDVFVQDVDASNRVIEKCVPIIALDVMAEQIEIAAEIENSLDVGTDHDVIVLLALAFEHFFFDDADVFVEFRE